MSHGIFSLRRKLQLHKKNSFQKESVYSVGSKEVLFQITEENLETGLRGIPVGYCTTSRVDPEKGLFYCEHPITEVADWEPERVIFLLYYGHDGTPNEIHAFKQELKKRAGLPK